jgi:hypothetical protein
MVLVVDLDYILDSDVCFSRAWNPFPDEGGGGGGEGVSGGVAGISPPQLSPRESGGGNAPEVKYWENFPCKIL